MIEKEVMDELRKNIGESVTVEETGSIVGPDWKETQRLTVVENFRYIVIGVSIGGSVCGFINEYGAIKKVTREHDGKILYENPYIKDDWPPHQSKSREDVFQLRAISFGDEIAGELDKEEQNIYKRK